MIQNARGTRDFLPDQQILRQEIIGKLRTVFERFGYSPLDTPAIERQDTLSAKYAGGDEILKEMFTLKDQGERELGLRYDLTVPLARVVAQNPSLKMPFKRYHIDKVWRDGPVQKGRYREFIQCDIDSVGSSSRMMDAELLRIIDMGFAELDLKVVIKVNSILVLDGILAKAGIQKAFRASVILSLDKLEKIGAKEVQKELEQKGISLEQITSLFELIQIKGTNKEKLAHLKHHIDIETERKGLSEVEEILGLCAGFKNEVVFEPSLARGLSYYTGMIVETFLVDSAITSAVCAGGRYDKMISEMVDSDRAYPAAGVSFGVDRIFDAMHKVKSKKTVTTVLVIPIQIPLEASRVAMHLREQGINTDVAYDKNLSKALDFANALSIPFCIFVGAREIAEGKVKLKNMVSGEEVLMGVEEAVDVIKSA